MAGSFWQAKIETPVRDDLSLKGEVAWPDTLAEPPECVFYENPDKGVFVCEVFLKAPPSPAETKQISLALSEFLGLPGLKITFRELPQQDWVRISLDHLSPIQAGRFFVHGSHDKDKVPNGKVAILIDASLAFGTGHHETTRGCLLALEGLAGKDPPKAILDLGTGSGILAIAAAKIWPKAEILASDIDPKAIEKAVEFGTLNKARGINWLVAEGFDDHEFKGKTFDLVIANILSGPLIDLAPEIAARLKPGGRIILAGLLDTQRGEVLKAYLDLDLSLESETIENEWPVLVLARP